MADDLDQELRFRFESHGSSEEFKVVQFEGTEGLSQLYRFEITLVCADANVDFDEIMAASATLKIKSHDSKTEVPYHGVITTFEQIGKTNEYYFYRAILEPRFAKLKLDCVNEIYTADKPVPQIIEDVLKKLGLSTQDYEFVLKDSSVYRSRSFICQYRESSFNFISRWLEKLGIYYYFDHAGSVEKLMITDYGNSHSEVGKVTLDYCQPEDLQTANQDHVVFNFTCKKTITPSKVVVQDYNYRTASMLDSLKAEVPVQGENTFGNVMSYGDNIRNVGEAKHLATVRQEQIQAYATIFTGTSTAIRIRPGELIGIKNHYRDSMNAEYLITTVKHSGSQAGALLSGITTPSYIKNDGGTVYMCCFEAISKETQFRPRQRAQIPVIAGVLSAVIDDESAGKYAQLDEFGQYKIDPLYDMTPKKVNKKSSWVRMASPYAGLENGMHFPLIKGSEVILSFMNGDPDCPIILGAVYNSTNRNIVSDENSTQNVIKTAGGNLIVCKDDDGGQSITFRSPSANTTIIYGKLG